MHFIKIRTIYDRNENKTILVFDVNERTMKLSQSKTGTNKTYVTGVIVFF